MSRAGTPGGEADVVVVGAGLVGAALAYGMARRGLRVTMLDEADAAYRASRGNFGLVWIQGKGRGFRPYARWTGRAPRLWPELVEELGECAGVRVDYRKPGGVLLALGDDDLQSFAEMLAQLERESGNEGYEYEMLDRGALAGLLPDIGPGVAGGSYCPHDGHANPLKLLRALHAGVAAYGGRYRTVAPVRDIEPLAGGGFRVHAGGGEAVEAGKLVLAAGLGSAALGPRVGLRVPVEPLHGQIVATARTAPRFDIPTNLVRQTDEGTFLLGFSEDDVGHDTRARAATSRDIAWRCARAFPFLENLPVVRTWAALRVMTPDGFPVYDQSRECPGAFSFACHSGVTLAANHALVAAGWVADGEIPAEYRPLSVERFDVPSPA